MYWDDDEDNHGWLVISRKPKEPIQIGEDVLISISRIEGNRVWIGIKAPNKKILRIDLPKPDKSWNK
jgi:carbon storage regulator CsrA